MKTTKQTTYDKATKIYKDTPQSCVLLVKYLGPTNTRGSRVKIINHDLKHRNNDKPLSITIGFDYQYSDISTMVLAHLINKGINLKLEARNHRIDQYDVLAFKWDVEELAKLFNIELEG